MRGYSTMDRYIAGYYQSYNVKTAIGHALLEAAWLKALPTLDSTDFKPASPCGTIVYSFNLKKGV